MASGGGSRATQKGASEDVAVVHGPTEDGAGSRILRLKDGKLSAGELRPVADGQPINGKELVRLRPREGLPMVCDVEVLYDGTQAAAKDAGSAPEGPPNQDAGSGGPARVSNPNFRKNWDRTFAGKRSKRHDWSLN